MGLDIIVGKIDDEYDDSIFDFRAGSYSGFHDFRDMICRIVHGEPTAKFTGFGGYLPWDDNPINILLHHSDCDGEITADEAKRLLPALEEVRLKLIEASADHDPFGQIAYAIGGLDNWIKACELAIENNMYLIFC